MTKTDLIKNVRDELGIKTADVKDIFDAIFDEITMALEKGEEVNIPGFGKFDVKMAAARTCRNPKTGEPLDVPEKRRPKFSFSSVVKKAVEGA